LAAAPPIAIVLDLVRSAPGSRLVDERRLHGLDKGEGHRRHGAKLGSDSRNASPRTGPSPR
jgi:hypothetical protein